MSWALSVSGLAELMFDSVLSPVTTINNAAVVMKPCMAANRCSAFPCRAPRRVCTTIKVVTAGMIPTTGEKSINSMPMLTAVLAPPSIAIKGKASSASVPPPASGPSRAKVKKAFMVFPCYLLGGRWLPLSLRFFGANAVIAKTHTVACKGKPPHRR